MLRLEFMIFAFLISRISCDCVRYTFEDDYNDLFQASGHCDKMEFWDHRYYNITDLMGKNERSASFISPRMASSCVSSFMFTMAAGGIVEVVIYMEPTEQLDQIAVIVSQYVANGNDGVVGTASNLAMDPSFVSGWHTLRINLSGNGVYQGYISMMGMASRNSIVLVDSFRYVPPNMDESLCRLYEEDGEVPTTQQPATTTQSPTVPEATTRPPAIIIRPPPPPEATPGSRPPVIVNVKLGVHVDLYKR